MSDFNANNERAVALEVKSLCGRYVISDLNFIFLKKGRKTERKGRCG